MHRNNSSPQVILSMQSFPSRHQLRNLLRSDRLCLAQDQQWATPSMLAWLHWGSGHKACLCYCLVFAEAATAPPTSPTMASPTAHLYVDQISMSWSDLHPVHLWCGTLPLFWNVRYSQKWSHRVARRIFRFFTSFGGSKILRKF